MKRGGGDFFSYFSRENKKGGRLTFYSIFSWGKKYAGRYDMQFFVSLQIGFNFCGSNVSF